MVEATEPPPKKQKQKWVARRRTVLSQAPGTEGSSEGELREDLPPLKFEELAAWVRHSKLKKVRGGALLLLLLLFIYLFFSYFR